MKNTVITRNDPFGLISPFFDEFFFPESNSYFNGMMKTDIKDNGDHYQFKVDVPDIKRENISLTLDDGYLTLKATQSKNDDEKENGRFVRKERYYGSCKRSFYVGDEIKAEDICAKLENGVLTLKLMKKEPEKKVANTIEIK